MEVPVERFVNAEGPSMRQSLSNYQGSYQQSSYQQSSYGGNTTIGYGSVGTRKVGLGLLLKTNNEVRISFLVASLLSLIFDALLHMA